MMRKGRSTLSVRKNFRLMFFFLPPCHTSYPHKAAFHDTPSAHGSGDVFRSLMQLLRDSAFFRASHSLPHRSFLTPHRRAPPSLLRLSPYPQPVNNSRPVFSPVNPHSYPPYSQAFRRQLPCRFFSSYGSEPAHSKPLLPVSSSRTPLHRKPACPVCG